ncbi:MAG: hypothetical protein HWN66_11890 [Candidatus Helarchaeota archaeon]|nr:hypothetical protein [Candidatus Helarchaeota archaeon]
MTCYVMVEATAPADQFEEGAKVALETRGEYPGYIKKVVDIGENFVNYTIYAVEDAKVVDALKFITNRYYKIAKAVPGYDFYTRILLDTADWMAAIR